MKPIEIDVHGVKCDAPGCGWSDMSVPRAEYAHWRNAPCPRCGANVFTDADWSAMRRIERTVGFLNRVLFFLPAPKRPHPSTTSVEFGGRGVKSITTSIAPAGDNPHPQPEPKS